MTAPLRFEHLVLGKQSPSLEEIRSSCSASALGLWDAASALACWRARQEEEVNAAWTAHQTEPAEQTTVPLVFEERGVGPIDLARAIVALHPESLPTLDLRDISAMWLRRLTSQSAHEIAYTWGRRWAFQAPAAIDTSELFRSLPRRTLICLARLDGRFRAGLITHGEALNQLVDDLVSRGLYGGRVPPAWCSRVESSFDTSACGHAIIGPPGSGKRTLLSRLSLVFEGRGVNVDNFHGGGFPNPKYQARPDTSYASLDNGLVCGWTYAHKLDPRLVAYGVEMALDPEANFHLVIAATPEEWAEVSANTPEVSRLRVLTLETPSDEELLPIWLCQRPMLEDIFGARMDLSWLIGRFDYLRRYGSLSELLRGLLPDRSLGGTLMPEGGHPLDGPIAARPTLSKISWKQLTSGRDWLPYLPTPDHLERLTALDLALSGKI